MAKKKAAAKFSDTPQRKGLLTRQCPSCNKYHHPRAASCPSCGYVYPAKKKAAKKKVVRKKPTRTKAASAKSDPLDAAIALVSACGGDLAAARESLNTIEKIRQL